MITTDPNVFPSPRASLPVPTPEKTQDEQPKNMELVDKKVDAKALSEIIDDACKHQTAVSNDLQDLDNDMENVRTTVVRLTDKVRSLEQEARELRRTILALVKRNASHIAAMTNRIGSLRDKMAIIKSHLPKEKPSP